MFQAGLTNVTPILQKGVIVTNHVTITPFYFYRFIHKMNIYLLLLVWAGFHIPIITPATTAPINTERI